MEGFRQSVGLNGRSMVELNRSEFESGHGTRNPFLQRAGQLNLSASHQAGNLHRRYRRDKTLGRRNGQRLSTLHTEPIGSLERPDPDVGIEEILHAFISHSDAKFPRTKSSSEGRRLISPRPSPNPTPFAPSLAWTGTTSARGFPRNVTSTGSPVCFTRFNVAIALALKSETSMVCISHKLHGQFYLVKSERSAARKRCGDISGPSKAE
jgi:hypothetical protein